MYNSYLSRAVVFKICDKP